LVRQPTPDEIAHLQKEGGTEAVRGKVSIEASGLEIRD
jgi:hypothetical protein